MAPAKPILSEAQIAEDWKEIQRRVADEPTVQPTVYIRNANYARGWAPIGTLVRTTKRFLIYDELTTGRRVKCAKSDRFHIAEIVPFPSKRK